MQVLQPFLSSISLISVWVYSTLQCTILDRDKVHQKSESIDNRLPILAFVMEPLAKKFKQQVELNTFRDSIVS